MKHIIKNHLLPCISALGLLALTGCYEDYVKDFNYSGAYLAYQYDLRTFVVGEGMEFKVGAVLGGVMENTRDRDVWFAFEDDLVTDDLRLYVPDAETPFTAFTEMTGTTSVGAVSQDYVKSAMAASGIKALTPLPLESVKVSEDKCFKIKKGYHTGTITIKADSAAFLALPGAGPKPYYAIGFHITSADVDTVLLSRSYEVIAVRYENMLFGDWYHNGKTEIRQANGDLVSVSSYHGDINSSDICSLSTVAPDAVVADKLGNTDGKLKITINGGAVSLSKADGSAVEVEDMGSKYNNARLLQNRQLYLNYKFANADGTVSVVSDTLSFRNRIRDGVNEWQDENPEHYN